MRQRFYSKRDPRLGLLLSGIILLPVILAFFLPKTSHNPGPPPAAVLLSIELFIGGGLAWLWFGTWYETDGANLYYKVAFYKSKIPISSIHGIVRHSKRSLYNFGLSTDMLLIKYNTYDDISISPRDQEGFINALKMINPAIAVEG